jgi:hypothetical protein
VKKTSQLYLMFLLAFTCGAAQANTSLAEIKAFCHELQAEGLSDEDARIVVDQCIEEQSEYLAEGDSTEPEPEEVDCYQEVEAQLENVSDDGSSYDALLQECFNKHN